MGSYPHERHGATGEQVGLFVACPVIRLATGRKFRDTREEFAQGWLPILSNGFYEANSPLLARRGWPSEHLLPRDFRRFGTGAV